MRHFFASHSCNRFLKPGEAIISPDPILVSTILGSCVAVTMYSPAKGIGAICHAMLPLNLKQDNDLHYVDTAVRYLYQKMQAHGGHTEMIIKLFGGAQVLAGGYSTTAKLSVGEQNIIQAHKTLNQLGLLITNADIGGTLGRKLHFSMKTGDVYLRKLKLRGVASTCTEGEMG